MKAADNIEREQGDKQRAHHADIKSLKNEIEVQHSRLRMSEADLAKSADKLKKREIEVGCEALGGLYVCLSCDTLSMLFDFEKLWKKCRCNSPRT